MTILAAHLSWRAWETCQGRSAETANRHDYYYPCARGVRAARQTPGQRQNQSAHEINGRDEHGIWIWRWTQKIWINDEDGSKEKAGGYSHRNEARRKETEAWLRKNLRSTRPAIIPSLECASACFSRSLVATSKAPLLANGLLGKLSSWPSATRQPVEDIETNAQSTAQSAPVGQTKLAH